MNADGYIELKSPATGVAFGKVNYHCFEEAVYKLQLSKKVQKEWKTTSLTERIQLVQSAMQYFSENREAIARDITSQMGKPITQSRNEIKGMLHRAEVCCQLAEDALKDIDITQTGKLVQWIRREPLGVVLNIAAWNYPLLIAVNVVVPALLAGNAVAIKHSSLTPLSAAAFEDAFNQAGSPKGLVTTLALTHATTERIINSPHIDHVAFTGSVGGGRKIQSAIQNHFIGSGFELGGKDPAYIREDADIAAVSPNVMDGVFYNGGQSCCAVERIYVHHSLYTEFCNGAIEFMNNLKIGDPMEEETDLGPMAQLSGVKTVQSQLEDAMAQGAKINSYSGSIPNGEHFIKPTICTQVTHDMILMTEETFGPIVGIMPVESDEEAVRLMNDSPFGLTASIWTKDKEKAIEIGSQIEAGTVYMNRCDYLDPHLPWVGVKDSGSGCTLSALGIQVLTRPKSYHFKKDV
ncbi:MAG: aldehyde dehydrogenase family protein [Candidatus Marinimicrobia bacterium]|nr:aldehyde dehydrogenase family protein [Candidatus Neomarinimicrobiota bacterium]